MIYEAVVNKNNFSVRDTHAQFRNATHRPNMEKALERLRTGCKLWQDKKTKEPLNQNLKQ